MSCTTRNWLTYAHRLEYIISAKNDAPSSRPLIHAKSDPVPFSPHNESETSLPGTTSTSTRNNEESERDYEGLGDGIVLFANFNQDYKYVHD